MDEIKVNAKFPEQRKLLMVGMPCYGCQMHMDATKSLIETMNNGVQFQWVSIGNESLISRARNNIISLFYNSKEFSHLLFLDADIYISGQDVRKLYDSGKDVIGAAVRLKADNVIYNFNFDQNKNNGSPEMEGETLLDEKGNDIGKRYYKVDKLGTAVIMLSRKAVEDVVENAKRKHEKIRKTCEKLKKILKNEFPKEFEDILNATDIEDILNVLDGVGYVYSRTSILMGGTLADSMPNEYYDVCKVGVNKDLYLSEDYYLCRDLKELGYNIYVDRTIRTKHNGMMEFQ